MKREEIVESIKNLEFPQGEYIIVWSWPMAMRGIKEANDIDIVVSPKLFNQCILKNREQIPRTYKEKVGEVYLRKENIELYLDVNCWSHNPAFSELLQRADIIEGIAFASLEDILAFKKEYVKKNPKHILDIEKIERYIQ